tara:strand:+ start:3748 stop:4227 length:480 start_codon:yes stop_codon:yes gene_type:complete
MILISHRGNINGRQPNLENLPEYIDSTLELGYDVEIDVWADKNNNLSLGHDYAQYPIEINWLLDRKEHLWVHCKNFEALNRIMELDLKSFYHEKEKYTIVSVANFARALTDNLIWAHNLDNVSNKCIIPLLSKKDITQWKPTEVYGICSDYVELLKNKK